VHSFKCAALQHEPRILNLSFPRADVDVSNEIDRYMALPGSDFDSSGGLGSELAYWAKKKDLPILRFMARQFLGTPASSANVERLFSSLKNVYRDNRRRLSPDFVEQALIAKHNLRSTGPGPGTNP
jgi:hypothetical protein